MKDQISEEPSEKIEEVESEKEKEEDSLEIEEEKEPKQIEVDKKEDHIITSSVIAEPSKPKSGVDSSAHISKPLKSSKKKSQ